MTFLKFQENAERVCVVILGRGDDIDGGNIGRLDSLHGSESTAVTTDSIIDSLCIGSIGSR